MTDPIKISVVSYLNSVPFIYGLERWEGKQPIDLQLDIPSACAEKLITGKSDIGLVPVAILPLLKEYTIISDYCIGADGPVTSVLLLSRVPMNEIKEILLDYQSRTSVMLTRILSEQLWNIDPQWNATTEHYEKQISGTTAGVVIGDRALSIKNQFEYVYDLSEEWKKLTGLPFMFAAWVSVKKLSAEFIYDFNAALKSGFDNIEVIIDSASGKWPRDIVSDYLKKHIDYVSDDKKKEALALFLKYTADYKKKQVV